MDANANVTGTILLRRKDTGEVGKN